MTIGWLRDTAGGVARVAALLALCATVADAHPIHTTLTVITADATGATFRVRAFADDFSGTVARFAGKQPPADSSATDSDVLRYVGAQFSVFDKSGARVGLQSCGIKREKELYWLCFRATIPSGGRGAKILNQMLTELHSDQVNIVQVERNGAKKTMLFTKGSAPALIGA